MNGGHKRGRRDNKHNYIINNWVGPSYVESLDATRDRSNVRVVNCSIRVAAL